jgi:DNA-binding transcriptional MerR regulator
MSLMNTSSAGDVISGAVEEGIGANDAHELAGITYRQLDHWARQGWVLPSLDPGKGRSGRRLYSRSDVVRLDLMRHLAISKVNTAQAGPLVSELKLREADVLVLWGPVGGKADLVVVARAAAVSSLASGGAWVVYDPNPIRRRLPRVSADADPRARSANAVPARRRSA